MRVGQEILTDVDPLELSISSDGLAVVKSLLLVNTSEIDEYIDIYATTSDPLFTDGIIFLYKEVLLKGGGTLTYSEEDFPSSDLGATLYGNDPTNGILYVATSSTTGIHAQYAVIDDSERPSDGGSSPILPTSIPLTPSDFMMSDNYKNYADMIADGGMIKPSNALVNLYAQKIIPEGTTAVSVYIYASTGVSLRCFIGSIVDGASSTVAVGSGNTYRFKPNYCRRW